MLISSTLLAARAASAQEQERERESGFSFGSYGRAGVASDLRGHSGRSTNIVSHGTRYDAGTYAELELRRDDYPDDLEVHTVATVAFGGNFFHYDGDFDESIAIRNLYAEVNGAFAKPVSLWAGSRMVRGDDIYLLDFWPLDNLNLMGGGGALDFDSFRLAAEVGLARPNNPFYAQDVQVAAPRGFQPATVPVLDRQRAVAALKGTLWGYGRTAPRGFKVVGYAEGHHVPSGTRQRDDQTFEKLDATSGLALGVQVGAYLDKPNAFVNLFFRCAMGVAAYDWPSAPELVGDRPATSDASACLTALSANAELGRFALQAGAYFRRLRDPSASVRLGGASDELAIDLRPHVWFGQHAGLSLDASYQLLQTRTLDAKSGQLVEGGVAKFAVIPFYSPMGRGSYTRPHLQLTYALSLRDAGARGFYPEQDRRSHERVEHFLGIGAEWWFNSTSY